MSDTKPSIAELQRVLAEMRSIVPGQTNDLSRGARAAILLAHTHVLLETAAAALALRDQQIIVNRVSLDWHRRRPLGGISRPSPEMEAEDRRLDQCAAALEVALAKVRP